MISVSRDKPAMFRNAPRHAMRIARLAVIGFGFAAIEPSSPVLADPFDMSFLRGSFASASGYNRWGGVYLGAHYGHSNMNTDFAQGTGPLVAYILRNTTIENEGSVSSWTTLSKGSTTGKAFGGFIGYNIDWGEVVLGVEGDYTRVGLRGTATDTISRRFTTSDGYENNVAVTGNSSVTLHEYWAVRGRAGYAFGQFLPYAAVGIALGRFDYSSSATVTASGTDISGGGGSPYSFGPETRTDARQNVFVAGLSAGVGMDVAITPNLFVRGEYEYVGFAKVSGNKINLQNLRVGLGWKF